MEEEAQKRKERLAALRKRKQESENGRSPNESEKNLQFRSYTPKDEDLRKHSNIATPDDIGETVESETKNLTKEALAKAAEAEKEEVDLLDLQPKKPNWDLKRDVEKKLEKLDRRTQRAVLELIRMRLANETDKTASLAEAVANAEAQQKLEAADED
ncbi:hypothetical protein VTP01DRAFT_73 [Rhizomucor pusillus]|uniref:uncharacterized protein n=1 Tax=Rhizomucor pusillus TaxID=4840 RepID=UPI0037428B31